MTSSFRKYTEEVPNLRKSPFMNGEVLFPFLVIEAKSEKGGRGFEAIEAQTAFPIRAFLDLQIQLRTATEVHLDPLVWFLSYQGDEWRVAGCIFNEGKYVRLPTPRYFLLFLLPSFCLFHFIFPHEVHPFFFIVSILLPHAGLTKKKQVIDLWFGRVLSPDGALQLLHIMDSICEWAREVYRISILSCLAGGQANLRHYTPAYTTRSTPAIDEHSMSSSTTHSSPVASARCQSVIDLTEDDSIMEDLPPGLDQNPDLNLDDLETQGRTVQEMSHPLLRWANGPQSSTPWTYNATIRHANMILLCFRLLEFPEKRESLEAFLRTISPRQPASVSARAVLELMLDEDLSVQLTNFAIAQIENEWVGTSQESVDGHGRPVRVHLHFSTFFNETNWQIVRTLDCIVCSKAAIKALAEVGNVSDHMRTTRQPPAWTPGRRPSLMETTKSLRSLWGKESVTTALSRLSLHLQLIRHDDQSFEYCWVARPPGQADLPEVLRTRDGLTQRMQSDPTTLQPCLRHSSELTKILPGARTPLSLQRLTRSHESVDNQGAVLLRKPSSWPRTCPSWCLLVLKTIDFQDEAGLGKILDHLRKASRWLDMDGAFGTRNGVRLTRNDDAFLQGWIESLLREDTTTILPRR